VCPEQVVLNICMKNTIQIFINQRFWKEIDATADNTGTLDMHPALNDVDTALSNGDFVIFGIRNPKDLTSVELRPLHYSLK